MSPELLLVVLVVPMVLSLAVGIWVGLGYPGLYGRYEEDGSRNPWELMVDWLVEKLDG